MLPKSLTMQRQESITEHKAIGGFPFWKKSKILIWTTQINIQCFVYRVLINNPMWKVGLSIQKKLNTEFWFVSSTEYCYKILMKCWVGRIFQPRIFCVISPANRNPAAISVFFLIPSEKLPLPQLHHSCTKACKLMYSPLIICLL